MNTFLQYIKRFALSTYYGLRQYFVQYLLFSIMAWMFMWDLGKFNMLGFALALCFFSYTMFFYWFKTFAQRLHISLQIIIPYIIYAIAVYLSIVSDNDWNFKIVTFDYYMRLGLLMPFCSLAIIGIEQAVKTLLPEKLKRIVSIVWNVLTIVLIALYAIAIVRLFFIF